MEFWQPDQQPEHTLATLPTCPNDQDHLYPKNRDMDSVLTVAFVQQGTQPAYS